MVAAGYGRRHQVEQSHMYKQSVHGLAPKRPEIKSDVDPTLV
jgi:hypothetical protein